MTPEQEREVRRLVEDEGLTEEKARELVSERQFDLLVGQDGELLIPPPRLPT